MPTWGTWLAWCPVTIAQPRILDAETLQAMPIRSRRVVIATPSWDYAISLRVAQGESQKDRLALEPGSA